jgi:hypothetical protein
MESMIIDEMRECSQDNEISYKNDLNQNLMEI